MRVVLAFLFVAALAAAQAYAGDDTVYTGDQRCQPPKDARVYSVPYDAKEHPNEYPTFPGADLPGWSCTYPREDGVIVQYGDSRTPQQQWSALYGGGGNEK